MCADRFLVPGVIAAVTVLAHHVEGTRTYVFRVTATGHPVTDLLLGILSYLPVGAVVPITLLLLRRTGQGPVDLGLIGPGWRRDIWPGLGLTAAGFGGTIAAGLVLLPVISGNRALFNQLVVGHVPAYYISYGLVVAAVTAITEECLVSGYLLVRLEQLGWNPQRALMLSLALRTSYHIYYGLGFLLTIPVGYFLTRSFQKRGRLLRPVVGHFLYDSVVMTIAVLTH